MSSDPETIAAEAACLADCLPAGSQDAIQSVLLATINGGSLDPATLVAAAREFIHKVPAGAQEALQVYLLCQILGAADCTPTTLAAAARCFNCLPERLQKAAQTYLICSWSSGGTGVCSHPTVLDWLSRMAADFVPLPRDDTIRAVCDFCNALDAAVIDDKILVVNPIIPDSLQAMYYPLIYEAGNGFSPWVNHGFLAADLNPDGLLGDGTGKYMEPGFVPGSSPALADDRGSVAIYEAEAALFANVELEYAGDDAVSSLWLAPWEPMTADGLFACWDPPTATVMGLGGDTPAFYCMSRTSVTDLDCYQANSVLGWNPVPIASNPWDDTGAALPTFAPYFMARNDVLAGNPGEYSSKRVSFMCVGTNLSTADVRELYYSVQTLRMQLGGGYV